MVNQISDVNTGQLEFSPGGKRLGFVSTDEVVLIDPINNRYIIREPLPSNHCGVISDRSCTFDSDGRLFAAGFNNRLVVIDVHNRQTLMNESMPDSLSASIGALAFTANGKELLLGGQMEGVWILDISTHELSRSSCLKGQVVGIQLLPDDVMFVVAHFMGEIDLWTRQSDSAVDVLSTCGTYLNSIVVGESLVLAGCGASIVQIWDSRMAEEIGSIVGHPYIAQNFSVSGDTGVLFAGSGPGTPNNPEGLATSELLLIDIPKDEVIASWWSHTADGIYDTAVSSDGRLLASWGYDGQINIWRWRE